MHAKRQKPKAKKKHSATAIKQLSSGNHLISVFFESVKWQWLFSKRRKRVLFHTLILQDSLVMSELKHWNPSPSSQKLKTLKLGNKT